MGAYYNEIEPYAAQWLRNLIAAGHIAPGDVDERSIVDVRPDDLRSYRQCHFFAGIGGWSYALSLAGWPDEEPVWTGSCPCQPLSGAGQRRGHADERHLWPAFHRLIAECQPAVVFGEQVAGKDGREWLAAIRADLEGDGYAVGAADLCAAGVGAPHIRQRLWWVANAGCGSRQSDGQHVAGTARGAEGKARQRQWLRPDARAGEPTGELADTDAARCGAWRAGEASNNGAARLESSGLRAGYWSDLDWLPCSDGKARPTQPGLQPLAHGVSGRMGRLRAYGNAIAPQVAAEFIKACMNEPA